MLDLAFSCDAFCCVCSICFVSFVCHSASPSVALLILLSKRGFLSFFLFRSGCLYFLIYFLFCLSRLPFIRPAPQPPQHFLLFISSLFIIEVDSRRNLNGCSKSTKKRGFEICIKISVDNPWPMSQFWLCLKIFFAAYLSLHYLSPFKGGTVCNFTFFKNFNNIAKGETMFLGTQKKRNII